MLLRRASGPRHRNGMSAGSRVSSSSFVLKSDNRWCQSIQLDCLLTGVTAFTPITRCAIPPPWAVLFTMAHSHSALQNMGKFSGRLDPGYCALKGEISRPVQKLRREVPVGLNSSQEGKAFSTISICCPSDQCVRWSTNQYD